MARALAVAVALVLLPCCAPTARTPSVFQAKAANAADSVSSALGSELVLLRAVRAGHTTAAYVSTATSHIEDDASSAVSSFLSMQPPDDKSDQLRERLSDLLDNAVSRLADARIAGRRGDTTALLALEPQLTSVRRALDDFATQNQ